MNDLTFSPPVPPPTLIETERLRLRAPRLEDAFDLRDLAAADRAFASATVGEAPSSLDSTCTAIARMLADRRLGLGAWWIVEEKCSGRVVGLTGYSSRLAAFGPINALATDVLGRGYARETIGALIASATPELRRHGDSPESSHERDEKSPEPGVRWYWQAKDSKLARFTGNTHRRYA